MDCRRMLICLALCVVWHMGLAHGQSHINTDLLARFDNLEKQVFKQKNQLEVQTKLLAELQIRVTNQESAIAKQQATINDQQTAIVEQQKTISEQQEEISQQQSEQHRRVIQLEDILKVHASNQENSTETKMVMEEDKAGGLERTSGVVQHLQPKPNRTVHVQTEPNTTVHVQTEPNKAGRVQIEPNKTSHLDGKQQGHGSSNVKPQLLEQRLVLNYEGPVAFHAVNTNAENSHVGVGQHIMFNKMLLNQGGGYHNLHGTFIAPAAGLYIFSTSVMIYNHDSFIAVSIVKNGAALARTLADGETGSHDHGSITVVTQLAIGDEVWVSLYGPADASYYGDSYTSFMGGLITAY